VVDHRHPQHARGQAKSRTAQSDPNGGVVVPGSPPQVPRQADAHGNQAGDNGVPRIGHRPRELVGERPEAEGGKMRALDDSRRVLWAYRLGQLHPRGVSDDVRQAPCDLLDRREARSAGDPQDEPVQIGDVILIKVGANVANHAGVYLGDQMMIHHSESRLSARVPYDGFWLNSTHSIWRHSEWQKLNFMAILNDLAVNRLNLK